MKHFDELYELAVDAYGLITASQAAELGIAASELNRWCMAGRLERRGQGVYKLTRYVPTPFDAYAEAVVLAGKDAYLHGEGVLAMHGLALVNPSEIAVATPHRVRRRLPAWVHLVKADPSDVVTCYQGIPAQTLAGAILACQGSVMSERLIQAVDEAYGEGLITHAEQTMLKGELHGSGEDSEQQTSP